MIILKWSSNPRREELFGPHDLNEESVALFRNRQKNVTGQFM